MAIATFDSLNPSTGEVIEQFTRSTAAAPSPPGRFPTPTFPGNKPRGLIWNCVVAGMAQTKQVVRVGRRP